ncbi:hypothetical protein ACIA5E_21035 [Nocardia asteroides]|uniref:hypothetical protein n=1 Tax=Nocardia asteroides TaxID=1824 RepID=UPI00378A2BB6
MFQRTVRDGRRLTDEDQLLALRIAADELEEKILRKQAVVALAHNRGLSADDILTLLASDEQGVQRTTVLHLAELYRDRPADPDFFLHCVQIANASDDVGIGRRLIPVLLEIDLAAGVTALSHLDTSEIGTRRRIAEHLERHEGDIRDPRVKTDALALLARCLEDSNETGWKARCRQFHARLSGD